MPVHMDTAIRFECADKSLQRLWEDAEKACLGNLKEFGPDRVLTEGGGYRKIWLETQPMGGEMYALHDLEAAANNTVLFLKHQREDGRLPGSIEYKDGRQIPQFDKIQGFCLPWHALNLYYLMGEDRDYLQLLRDALIRFDEYLWKRRDSNGDGILESFCVYDTGEDKAVRYGDAPCWWPHEEAPQGYQVVPMGSMDVTSWSYAARDTLSAISLILKDGKADQWRALADKCALSIRDKLWDESRGACFDLDHAGKRVDVLGHQTMRCMYHGSLSQRMADRFVRKHLLNPAEFWTALPLPSTSVSDPAFVNAPENNWSGQCEGLTFQRAILALEHYGYDALIPEIGNRLFKAVIDGGYRFTQQFDPFTGKISLVSRETHEPAGPDCDDIQDDYGPTALSCMAYLMEMGGIRLEMGRVRFSALMSAPFLCEAKWGGRTLKLESDGSSFAASIGGKTAAEGKCGQRVLTDLNGNVLKAQTIDTNRYR